MKVKIVYPSGDSIVVDISPTTKYTRNFTLSEMANNKAKETVKLIITPDVNTFALMIQDFRDWYNKPITVNSWYRTQTFNKSVGGNASSAHLIGTALDWGVKGHTQTQRTHVKDKWADICKAHGVVGAINFYTGGYHLEAFSDKCYGCKAFSVRDYRGKKGDW